MEDGELLASFARDKSHDAFQELVRRHVGMVYSVCRRQLRDAHWAEDVTQAVFILLARKAETLPSDVILGGWLYKTAVFACSNARGLARTRTYHENRVTPMKVHDEQEDLERAEMEGLLDEGLMELSKSQREVLVLRFFEKKPLAEVARMRNESLYLTQKTLDAGLAKLRRFLSKRGVAAASLALLVMWMEESARAVPAGLAASVGNAALGSTALPSYAGQLATQILKQAGRAKLLASLTAVGMLLALAITLFAMTVSATPTSAALPVAVRSPAAQEQEAGEIAALWKTLGQAEVALRAMDMPALDKVVAYTDAEQLHNWEIMARVFAADQKLKRAAIARFGAEGGDLTAIETFGRWRLDQVLPLVDRNSLTWNVRSNAATLHFSYTDNTSAGGTLFFIKVDGMWKIDAGRSIDVALEGLGSNNVRVAVQDLDPSQRAGVIDRMDRMEGVLGSVADRIARDPTYSLAAARDDLDKMDNAAGSRAFFHLALRMDDQESLRQ